jgi:cytochrome c556
MKNWLYLVAVIFVSACAETPVEEEVVAVEKKNFEMYELSEMSAIMQHMYQINEQLKARIESGEELGTYSESFDRILEAEMTKGKDMDDFFKTHAESFLKDQRSIYENPAQAKELYNQAINSCISCHEVKCTGPIEKIEKLFIK